MKRLHYAVAAVLAFALCHPILAYATDTVPTYIEAATGTEKQGIGVGLISGSVTVSPNATTGAAAPTTGYLSMGKDSATGFAQPVKVDGSGILSVTGPLTDTQLRATAVPVSGPITDTQLRATALPVSGTVTANAGTGTFTVSITGITQSTGGAAVGNGIQTLTSTTTAAPSYSNNTVNMLSTTPAGALRTDNSAVSQPVIGTLTNGVSLTSAPGIMIGGTDNTNYRTLLTNSNGVLRVNGVGNNGAAAAGDPLLIAGWNGTNAYTLKTDASGNLKVDGSGFTQPVSGTVTANIGTVATLATATNQASVIGPLTPGTSATNSVLTGGVYLSTFGTLTTTQQSAFTLGSRGALAVQLCGANSTTCFANTTPADATAAVSGLPTYSQGQLFGATQNERARSIPGSFGSATGVTAVEHAGTTYVHLAANATTNGTKSGAGILHSVCINSKGAAANTLTLYDNTTAATPVIAVIDTTANVGCLIYDIGFATGLSEIMATGTTADVTIGFR